MNRILKNILAAFIILIGILINENIYGQCIDNIDVDYFQDFEPDIIEECWYISDLDGDGNYKLLQRDCDGTLTDYYSDIIVCIQPTQKEPKIKPKAYYDNGITLVATDNITDVYIYNMNGAIRYDGRMKPYETRHINLHDSYIIEFLWVINGDIQRESVKIFSFE